MLHWNDQGFVLFPIYNDVCLIHSYYSLIYFDIHAFISKPIHHLNLKDRTLQEFNATKNERSGLLKEEKQENQEVILMSEKHI